MVYYLTNEIRIYSDSLNFIPEILVMTKSKNIDEEDKPVWKRLGFFPTMTGALNFLIEVYPCYFSKKEGKEIDVFKKVLVALNNLKNEIRVKVLNEADIKEDFKTEKEEESEIGQKRKTRRTKKTG